MADILVIDDDLSIARAFERFLTHEQHSFRIAGGAEEGLRLIAERVPNLIFMDVRMPGLDGIQALPMFREHCPDADVVIMTAYSSSQTSIDAMRAGAFDLLIKPLGLEQLKAIIARVLEAQRVRVKLVDSPVAAVDEDTPSLVGESPQMHAVFKMIGRLATLDVPALVTGERGTGKRVVVATIHANSPRRDQPLTVIDCRGPEADAELRSVLEGAVTGTVHLAAVEALSVGNQTRLAAVLRPGQTLKVRLMASTEMDLADLVERGEFNQELREAIAVVTLRLPPLRERRDDIPLLVEILLRRLSSELGRHVRGVNGQVQKLLREHPWPANIIELSNVLRRAAILSATDVITVDDLGDGLSVQRQPARRLTDTELGRAAREALTSRLAAGVAPNESPYHDVVTVVEEALVQEALDITKGNQLKAAELLGVNRTTLRKRASGSTPK
jgi:DNA-binding NtrC family response regulator